MIPAGKMLIIAGGILVLVGVFLMFFDKLPYLGKLPGDINIRKETFEVHIPIMTSLVLSVLINLILWVVFQWKGK